jgi:alkylhydroperoxidase family enzyme
MNAQIAAWVAELLGDGEPVPEEQSALRQLVEHVTLAPWQCRNESFTDLRESGFDDSALFNACVAASSFGVFSRIRVALTALGQAS